MSELTRIAAKQHPSTCSCPACIGLECLERPRYFAGQLLTEAELNSEQAYVLAKNRLHNRYLHGWGVVCGLEVVCHECEGSVTVKQGYALDPCGNDLIVCADDDFNVIKAIRDCRDARRRKRRSECDPYEPVPDVHCKDVEETWCITLEYQETEARPITPLRREKPGSCGCGGHHAGPAKADCSPPKADGRTTVTPVCEPTRTREGYRLGIVKPTTPCAELEWPGLEKTVDGTLYARLYECLEGVLKTLRQHLTNDKDHLLVNVMGQLVTDVTYQREPKAVHDACCRLRQAVIDLLDQTPESTRCQLARVLDEITCPKPPAQQVSTIYVLNARVDEGGAWAQWTEWWQKIGENLWHLIAIIVQVLLDCICRALLPPCSPDPTDDRIILACVTVRGDKIIRVCNFACRRYAGSFPAWSYWMSLVPVLPVLGYVLRKLCCSPDLVHASSPVVNELERLIQSLDPAGSVRRALSEEDFALPKYFDGQVRNLGTQLLTALLRARTAGAEGVNLATLVGKSKQQVQESLSGAVFRPVKSAAEMTSVRTLLASPFADRDERVVVYVEGEKVVGFGPYDEVADLREQLEVLKSKVDSLEARR